MTDEQPRERASRRRTSPVEDAFRATQPKFQTKTDAAFDLLLQAIMYGELKPGDRIVAADWAAKSDISQGPVREAIRRLEAQRLVRVDPHRGASVTYRSRAQAEEIILIRQSLETLAARKAVERSTPEELARLIAAIEKLVKRQEADHRVRNWRGVNQLSGRIHATLYEASKLPVLVELIEAQRVAYTFDASSVPPTFADRTLKIHHDLLEALKTGDSELVASVIRADLKQIHEATSGRVVRELTRKDTDPAV